MSANRSVDIEVGSDNQSYAAGECHLADTTGRDNSIIHPEGGNAADGKTVAPVNVGHGKRCGYNSRKTGDITHLFERFFLRGDFYRLRSANTRPGTRMDPVLGISQHHGVISMSSRLFSISVSCDIQVKHRK